MEEQSQHLLDVIFERFARTGEWPVVDRLRHELDLADDELDVLAAGRDLDPNLGTVGLSHGDRAMLTVHGLARCGDATEVLDDLLRTMRLAYDRFRALGSEAHITSDDLRDDLGFTPLRIRRTYELLTPLPGIGGGTGSSSESWQREITADITAFKRARTVDDLVRLAPLRRGPSSDRLGAGLPPLRPRFVPETASDRLDELHPKIAAASSGLFHDGHYAQASFEAFKALEGELRTRSGLDLSGRALAEKALGGTEPTLVVSRHDGRTGKDEQEGIRFMLMGVIQGLRNPGGHELDVRDRQECLEELTVASLLMRWLDGSRAGARTDAPRPSERPPDAAEPRSRPSAAPPPPARASVLRELRDMSHRQARTSTILELDLAALSTSSGIEPDQLQDALVDLLAEGLVEPYAATMGKSAEQGACRITGEGIRELARLSSGRP